MSAEKVNGVLPSGTVTVLSTASQECGTGLNHTAISITYVFAVLSCSARHVFSQSVQWLAKLHTKQDLNPTIFSCYFKAK